MLGPHSWTKRMHSILKADISANKIRVKTNSVEKHLDNRFGKTKCRSIPK